MSGAASQADIIFARLLTKLKASGPIRMELFETANELADLSDDEFLVEIMKRHSPITEEEGAAQLTPAALDSAVQQLYRYSGRFGSRA